MPRCRCATPCSNIGANDRFVDRQAFSAGALIGLVADQIYMAPFSRVRVGIDTLIGMRLRKVVPSEIVHPLITASKA